MTSVQSSNSSHEVIYNALRSIQELLGEDDDEPFRIILPRRPLRKCLKTVTLLSAFLRDNSQHDQSIQHLLTTTVPSKLFQLLLRITDPSIIGSLDAERQGLIQSLLDEALVPSLGHGSVTTSILSQDWNTLIGYITTNPSAYTSLIPLINRVLLDENQTVFAYTTFTAPETSTDNNSATNTTYNCQVFLWLYKLWYYHQYHMEVDRTDLEVVSQLRTLCVTLWRHCTLAIPTNSSSNPDERPTTTTTSSAASTTAKESDGGQHRVEHWFAILTQDWDTRPSAHDLHQLQFHFIQQCVDTAMEELDGGSIQEATRHVTIATKILELAQCWEHNNTREMWESLWKAAAHSSFDTNEEKYEWWVRSITPLAQHVLQNYYSGVSPYAIPATLESTLTLTYLQLCEVPTVLSTEEGRFVLDYIQHMPQMRRVVQASLLFHSTLQRVVTVPSIPSSSSDDTIVDRLVQRFLN